MAQTGYTPIQLYYSSTTTNVPLAANLAAGELALNTADGKLFYKDNGGVVQVLATKAAAQTTFQTSLGGLTPSTATSGAVTLAGTLNTTSGGTGLTSWTAGDLPYYATGTTLSKLGIGTNGQILTSTGTAPQWSTLSGVAVTTFSAGTTGFTPSSATSGAVTLAGTLATTNGGTGLTSFTANRVFYASSTSAIGQSANLTFDGTTLTAANFTDSSLTSGRVTYAGTGGNLTDSANLTFDGTNLTLGGGTANGVAYLNGSKVLTTGSALSFDGTNLSLATGKVTTSTAGTGAGFQWGGTTTTSRLYDDGSGNVYLDVGAGASNTDVPLFIRTKGSGGTMYFQPAGTNGYVLSTTGQIWSISGSEGMRLTSTGLGIGTSSPGERLDVVGTARVIRSTGATNTGDQNTVVVGATTTGAYAASYGAGLQFQVTNSGGGYSGGRIVSRLGADNFTANLVFQARNYGYADNMVLDPNGNLGIGTSTPSQKLEVVGAIRGTVTPSNSVQASLLLANSATTSAANLQLNTSGGLAFWTFQSGGAGWFNSATLDTSGNLGLGVTPSASTVKAFQVPTSTVIGAQGEGLNITTNAYFDSSWKRHATGTATWYQQATGQHAWWTAGSAAAGTAISFTQAMTLDASGNLVVGNTSASYRLDVWGSTSIVGHIRNNTVGTGALAQLQFSTSNNYDGFSKAAVGAICENANTRETALGFYSENSNGVLGERGRFTAGGYFKASDNGTYNGGSTSLTHEFNQSVDNNAVIVYGTNATLSTSGMVFLQAARNTTNNSFYALSYYNSGAAAYKWRVADSGNVTNTNGSYGTISDAKMKTDIVDAGSQWADIKAVRFRKFKMKDDPEQIVQLGVVAQELEQTSPGLVEEHTDRDGEGNDLGTTTKSVKTSVLLMKAAVALQEAMARIEQLEAKVAALEAK